MAKLESNIVGTISQMEFIGSISIFSAHGRSSGMCWEAVWAHLLRSNFPALSPHLPRIYLLLSDSRHFLTTINGSQGLLNAYDRLIWTIIDMVDIANVSCQILIQHRVLLPHLKTTLAKYFPKLSKEGTRTLFHCSIYVYRNSGRML
jgi:hypothetical protein